MTPAVLSLLIFAVVVVLFVMVRFPMATVAIAGCTLMVSCGVCKFSDAFSPFASSTIVLVIGVMVIGAAISETGLARVIGTWVIKASGGVKTRLIVLTYLAACGMSAFLTNSAVLAIFIPIIMGLSHSSDSMNEKELIMPITMGCILGGASTLSGSTQQLVTQGYLETLGERTFHMFDLTPVGGIMILLGLLYSITIGRRIGCRLWRGDTDVNRDAVKTDSREIDKKKVVIVALIFGFAVVSYITEWIPLAVTSTTAALLCIFTGCISQKTAIEKINWNIVGRFGGYLGMAKALEVSGGTLLIAEFFQRLLGNSLTPMLLLILVVLLTKLVSEFMSPSAALVIVLPMVFSLIETLNLNAWAYSIAATFASSTALSTPLASTTLGMSMSVGYRFNDYFKYYIWFDIITFFALIAVIPLMYGLVT